MGVEMKGKGFNRGESIVYLKGIHAIKGVFIFGCGHATCFLNPPHLFHHLFYLLFVVCFVFGWEEEEGWVVDRVHLTKHGIVHPRDEWRD